MTLFKDFLREKAKFYSPPTTGHKPDDTSIHMDGVRAIHEGLLPKAAWKDADMIENLLKTVDDRLGDRVLPAPEAAWERHFEPEVDDERTLLSWSVNKQKSDAMGMVKFGAIDALGKVMHHLGRPIRVIEQSILADEELCLRHNLNNPLGLKFDYALLGYEGKVLVQVEAPDIVDSLSSFLESPCIRVSAARKQTLSGQILSKMCLFMGPQRVNWLALTSHHKWVFLRFHGDQKEPYLTYSTTIPQENDTRPFRALLGMMLASEFKINVKSSVIRTGELFPLKEEEQIKEESAIDSSKQEGCDHSSSSSRITEQDASALCSKETDSFSGLLVAWSSRVAGYNVCDWFVCDTIIDSDWCPRFTKYKGPVRFRLIRGIGRGVTGVVYEGKLDIDGKGEDPCSRSFALKLLEMDEPRKALLLEGLNRELGIYRAIEKAKQEGKMSPDIVPRCYGLFKAKEFYILVTEYGGRALNDDSWKSLAFEDKIEVFKLVLKFHEIGIAHGDIRPQNFLRCDDGTFKMIDFTVSEFHKCEGKLDVSWYLEHGHTIDFNGPCRELEYFWLGFMKRFAPKRKRKNATA